MEAQLKAGLPGVASRKRFVKLLLALRRVSCSIFVDEGDMFEFLGNIFSTQICYAFFLHPVMIAKGSAMGFSYNL